jgi:hypothetical protein
MRICDDEHEEIVYNSGYCPLCFLKQQMEDLKRNVMIENFKLNKVEVKQHGS